MTTERTDEIHGGYQEDEWAPGVPFRPVALGWAVNGKREETDEAIKMLEEVGFLVIPVPESGTPWPRFRYKGRTYVGVDEIRRLTTSLRDTGSVPEVARLPDPDEVTSKE